MPFTTKIPIHIVRLPFQDNHELFAICDQHKILRLGETPEVLSGKYVEALQGEIFNKGNTKDLFDYPTTESVAMQQIQVSLPAAKNGYSYPELELTFDILVQEKEGNRLVFVPAIGVEVLVPPDELLEDNLRRAIRLEFGRKHRLRHVQKILSAIWYEKPDLRSFEEQVKVFSPKELEKKTEDDQKMGLLEKVTDPMVFNRQVAFERETEMQQVLTGVQSEFARSMLILGPAGSGKTALFQELSYQLKKKTRGSEPPRILKTSASRLIKDLTEGSGWQANMAILCQQLAQTQQLLYIGNLLELFEVGKYEGNEVSMAAFMLNYISRQEIAVLAECTLEEKNLIEQLSPTFLPFFRIIEITEPKGERLFKMVQQRAKTLSRTYGVGVNSDGIDEAIRLNKRFQPYSGFPNKPIRMLEGIQRFRANEGEKVKIDQQTVYQFFCSDTGMPRFMVDPAVKMDMPEVLRTFQSKLFGQEPAVRAVVDVLGRIKAGVAKRGQPLGSFLFVGPTGVGKTELAKNLAEFMFGNRNRLIRFDMSEYSDSVAVSRLTGLPGRDGVLTSAVRQQPFGVLLFDEIEKANRNFLDLLLQILDEGRLTDSRGQLVDFCSCLIIMTSNIGATQLSMNPVRVGSEVEDEDMARQFVRAVEQHFRPELYNRIGMVVPFHPLNAEVIRHITHREVKLILGQEGIRYRDLQIDLSDEVYSYLAQIGYDKQYGARYLKRILLREFTTPLSRHLNEYPADFKLKVQVKPLESGDGLLFDIEAEEPAIHEFYDRMDAYYAADDASRMRRSFHEVQEGSVVLRLESALYQLRREMERMGSTRFYQDASKTNALNRYTLLLEKGKRLTHEIQMIEEEVALQTVKAEGGQHDFQDFIRNWKTERRQYFLELYEAKHKTSTQEAYFLLFSLALDGFLKFYIELFKLLPFEVYASSVWYHKSSYQAVKSEKDSDTDPYLYGSEVHLEGSSKAYAKTWNKPPKKGAVRIGMRFRLEGRLVYLHLQHELGLWEWKSKNVTTRALMIAGLVGDKLELPENVHLKKGYQGTPRRICKDGQFRDLSMQINRLMNIPEVAALVAKVLERMAEERLLKEVV